MRRVPTARPRQSRGLVEKRARASASAIYVVASCLAWMGSSCTLDPVHNDAVKNLGDERADRYPPESQYHRPGEPCGVCHSPKGPAERTFALSGTVFWGPDNYDRRVDQAYVKVTDARGARRCFVTNCNGNFFVPESDFPNITFPILVSVERTKNPGGTAPGDESTSKIQRMGGHIGRESSCAVCHIQGLRDYASPGQIWLYSSEGEVEAAKIPITRCPPDPAAPRALLCPEDRL